MVSLVDMQNGAMPVMGMGGMPDVNALIAQAMAMSGGYAGMQPPPKEEGVTYLCVVDMQITDRRLGQTLGRPATGASTSGPKVQQMRMVAATLAGDLGDWRSWR